MINAHEEKSKEYLNKIFRYSTKEILYKNLYESFKKKESPIQSLTYSEYFSNLGIHMLYNTLSIDEAYYFSEYEYTLNIIDSNKNSKSYSIYSTYEIYEIVKDYNLDNLFFDNVKYLKNYNYLSEGKILNFNYELSNFVEIPLTENIQKIYNFSEPILPRNLSEYYNLYFEYDDLLNKIEYYITKERQSLFNLIIRRLSTKKIFKFSGPSGIGKSFFLLYFSRTRCNCIYINLNAVRKLLELKQYNKLKNVIAAECRRVSLNKEDIISFNKMMTNINEMRISNIIDELVKFFSQIKNIIIILDQFKTDISIDDNKLGNIRLILCSSINDKDIRQNCIENFINLLKGNDIDYNKYVYIPKLCQHKNGNKIYSFFNNIPKYISMIKNCQTYDDYDAKLKTINNGIIERIKSFCKSDFSEYIMKIRQYLNVFIYISDFSKIIDLYPLKYFIFQFYSDKNENNIILYNDKNLKNAKYFKVSFLFPYMEEIIEGVEMEEQKKFFNDGLYKKHTGSTIGGFFELVTIQSIKENNLKLPGVDNHHELRVARICDMSEIKPTLSEYIKNVISDNKIVNDKNDKNDKNDNKMKIDNNDIRDYNKNNSLFDSLDRKVKIDYQNLFIFKENSISEIIKEYIENYNCLKIMVNEKLAFASNYSNLFKIETQGKQSKEDNKNNSDKQDITINIINNNYDIKEKNILVTQKFENAAVYDLAYLYGASQEKIFIGFQIKSYKDYKYYEKNKRTFSFNKKNVIDRSKQLLLNSKYLLGINIVEWHFIIIGIYFNEKELKLFEEHRTYSESLIKYCEDNNLELILYNPIANKFYDSNKIELTGVFSLSNISNLIGKNNNMYKFPKPDNYFLGRKRNLNRLYESIETLEILTKEKIDKSNIITEMKNICTSIENALDIKDLKFVNSDIYDNNANFIPIPADNFLIMFKEKKDIQLKGIKNYCFLVKKPEKDYMLFLPSTDQQFISSYAIQYFYYFDLKQKYYIFNFKGKKKDKENKKDEDKNN